ncbi:MAG: hypothetical protein PF444_08495 [Bacteroidales bacterium]|jgi:hypothetical protein|nr:hypothetical protein [Bacteroidales bacterium]
MKKNMNKLIVGLVLMAVAVCARAYDAADTIVTPTQREDGTALGLSEIKGFTVYCGVSGSEDYQSSQFISGATLPSTDIVVKNLPVGLSDCVFTSIDTDNRESLYSAIATYSVVIDKANPKAPAVQTGIREILIPYQPQ